MRSGERPHATSFLLGYDGRTEQFASLREACDAAAEAISQEIPVEIRVLSGDQPCIWRYVHDDKMWVMTPL